MVFSEALTSGRGFRRVETAVVLLLWAVVLLMAIVFAQERLFADSAYYFFHSVNKGYPQVDHQRFVLAISEVLPIIGSHIGVPMKWLVLLYSVGHVLFGYLVFHHVYFRHGSRGQGLLVLLLQFTAYSNLFFSPMLELWYGLILLALLDHRISMQQTKGWKDGCILFVLTLSVLFSHPENFIVFFLVVGYRWYEGKVSRQLLAASLLIVVGVILFKFNTFSEYESGKVNNAKQAGEGGFMAVFAVDYMLQLGKMLVMHYYDCLIYIIIGTWILWRSDRRWGAFIPLAFALAFIAFINLTLQRNEYGRYTESCYLPLAFIGLYMTALVWDRLGNTGKYALGGFILLMSVVRIHEVSSYGHILMARTAQMKKFISLARADHNGKMALRATNITTEYTQIGWSYAMESLILSSCDGPDHTASVIFDEDLEYASNHTRLNPQNFVLRRFDLMEHQHLNSRYFNLPESKYTYSEQKTEHGSD